MKLARLTTKTNDSGFYSTDSYNPEFIKRIQENSRITDSNPYTFCIVGAGPAGFYAAKSILNTSDNIKLDIVDAQPHPFGLIRNGVAPDHQAMKKIQYDYDTIFSNKNGKFYGNITVGEDISITELMKYYSGVILAYGASKERLLDIPGENYLTSATDIINWYNGKIDSFNEFLENINFDFDQLRDISVIGNGNVATDIARVFLKSIVEFAGSDMPDPVFALIKKPKINSVSMIARRGIYQSAFTTKEIREISKINKLKMYMWKQDIKESQNEASLKEAQVGSSENARAIDRRTNFLLSQGSIIENDDQYEEIKNDPSHKKLFLRYFLSPVSVDDVQNMSFSRTKLTGEPNHQRGISVDPPLHVKLKSDLFLKSVGYRSLPIDGVPFDYRTHTIPNDKGGVINEDGEMVKGLYVGGWAKRGPVGIIDATLRDSYETFRMIKYHIDTKTLDSKINSANHTLHKVKKQYITYEDWLKVMKEEDKNGMEIGKPREKFLWKIDYERITGKTL